MDAEQICGVSGLLSQIDSNPGIDRLRSRLGQDGALDPDLSAAFLDEARRSSDEVLFPFDRTADRQGCRLEEGRVRLAPGHAEAWAAFRKGGWTGLDIGTDHGGQRLLSILALAAQELFDRGSVSFGMASGAARSAARLLEAYADPDIVALWVPKLAAGEWGATICISEPDAGSDIGRIRTAAIRVETEAWRMTGEKIWISFGDHGLVERIGHLVLARPYGAPPGISGLSLFLVPTTIENERCPPRNGVTIRRIEEKLGLHASPTCAIGFEDSDAILIGEDGRGLAQLFRMIVSMRLQVGTRALGLSTSCYAAAITYACDRRQGGHPDAPAVAIINHPDVQLMLAGMASRIATLRGLVYAAGVAQDIVDHERDERERNHWSSLLSWLLPVIKNSGAETAFEIAAEALLVFGGAGYTTEWPIKRHLRDSRILAIYEGTTGMQAQDLVRRRWLMPGCGYEAFAIAIEEDLDRADGNVAFALKSALAALESATKWLRDPDRSEQEILAACRAALRLASEVAHGWIAARLLLHETEGRPMAAAAKHALSVLDERLAPPLLAMREAGFRARSLETIATAKPQCRGKLPTEATL